MRSVRHEALIGTGLLPVAAQRAFLRSQPNVADRMVGVAAPELHEELLDAPKLTAQGAAQLVHRLDETLLTSVLKADRRDQVLSVAMARCSRLPVKLQMRLAKVRLGANSSHAFANTAGLDPGAALAFLRKNGPAESYPNTLWVAAHTQDWEAIGGLLMLTSGSGHDVVDGILAEFPGLRRHLYRQASEGSATSLFGAACAHATGDEITEAVAAVCAALPAHPPKSFVVSRAAAVLCDSPLTPVALREQLWALPDMADTLARLGCPEPDTLPHVTSMGAVDMHTFDMLMLRAGTTKWGVSRISQFAQLSASPHAQGRRALRLAGRMTDTVASYHLNNVGTPGRWLLPAFERLLNCEGTAAAEIQPCFNVARDADRVATKWRQEVAEPVETIDCSPARPRSKADPIQPKDALIPASGYSAVWSAGAALLVERLGDHDNAWHLLSRLLEKFDGTFAQLADTIVAATAAKV